MAKEIKEVSLEGCVNAIKLERAQLAIQGLSHKRTPLLSESAEWSLWQKGKEQGLEGNALILFIYEGLKGLVNVVKAKVNRENEAKLAKAKRSR